MPTNITIPDRSTQPPIQNITENIPRHARGPVQNISSVTLIVRGWSKKLLSCLTLYHQEQCVSIFCNPLRAVCHNFFSKKDYIGSNHNLFFSVSILQMVFFTVSTGMFTSIFQDKYCPFYPQILEPKGHSPSPGERLALTHVQIFQCVRKVAPQ